ncbi:MAG: UvrD-helicase domain-containing protein [Solirubrobacterales bacterium]
MRRAPTAEQAAAIAAGAPAVLLEAGAGTGKTGVLVDRYCDLLDGDGAGLDGILAFTFTERAGAQLRERIGAELTRRIGGAGEGERAARLREARDGLGGAWITTIHSFCRRLLASHPVASGIDPSFRVLEAAESQRAARRAFEAALEEFLAEEPDREVTVAAFGIEGLRSAVLGVHERMRSSGDPAPELPPAPESDPIGALQRLESAAGAVGGIGSAGQKEKVAAARAIAAAREREIPSVNDLLYLQTGSSRADFEPFDAAVSAATKAVAELSEGRLVHRHLSELVLLFGARFAEAKEERSGLDFEDLQIEAVRLLREHAGIRDSYTERFREILVDEFQDTNAVQLDLVELLRGPGGRVFFVGDEFQSIYGFRHADIKVFRREREALRTGPAGSVLPLVGNFRSRPEVIATANRIGEAMLPGFRPLEVGSAEQAEGEPPGGGHAVELLLTEEKGWEEFDLRLPVDDQTPLNRVAEARFLARRLRDLTDLGVPRGEMVVLLRAFTHVDAYEEALERMGLSPYVVGGRGYWSSQPVGDLLALLRAIANPLDDEALLGTLASPAFGASPDALWLLRRAAGKGPLHHAVLAATGAAEVSLAEPSWLEHLPEADREALGSLQGILAEMREHGARLPLEETIERALTACGYDLAVLIRGSGRMRVANLRKLIRMAREYERSEGRDLRGFLDFAEFRTGLDDDPLAATEAEDHDGVRVMTIHTAKGLEFEVVAVPSLDRRLLAGRPPALTVGPREQTPRPVGLRLSRIGAKGVRIFDYEEIQAATEELASEEERRLFYVAATRAKGRLILSGIRPGKPPSTGPGTPVLARLLESPGFGGVEDGALVNLPAPEPREGLDASFADAAVEVRVNAPDERQVERLVAPAAVGSGEAGRPAGRPPILGRAAPPTPVGALSYSALAEHGRCGFRFYAERVLGMRSEDALSGEAGARRAERFGFGSAVHSLLEWSASRRWVLPPAELVGRSLEGEGLGASAELVEAATASVEGWISSGLRAELEAKGTRLRAEVPFLLELGGAMVRGSIDLLAEPSSGPPVVIDYKTDSLGEQSPAERAGRYEVQRMLYALAASRATGGGSVRVAYVFLEAPEDPVIEELGPAGLAAAGRSLAERVAGIAAGSFPVTGSPPWWLCRDCPARRRLCSAPASPPGNGAPA